MKKLYFTILILLFIGLKTYSQGTTGCPSITTSPDQTLPCSQTCTNLSADVFEVGETNTYVVNSIPYAPPIAYNAPGGNGISVNTDDVWSGVINLPFPFCFFGQTYNSAVVGSNGAISFNTGLANGFHPWSYSASVPSTALNSAGNIFGPYHDIDPSVSGSVRWYLTGQAPCRTLIVVYQNLGYYDCTSLRTNHMMVLYETTNIIEVYVGVKPTCNGWNNGNTVIGIQNPAGNVGYTPPGRNTGPWTLTTPEAWQFVPDGAPIYTPVEWYEGSTPVGTGATINVCPPNGGATYTARTTYTRCDGLQINVEDSVHIDYETVEVDVTPKNVFTCAGSTVTLNALSANANSFTWNPGGLTGQTVNVTPSTPTTYSVIGTNTVNGCSDTATATITFAEPVNSGCNVLYVSPTGSSGNDGTKASPLDLETALEMGACNGTIVKMAIGDYTTDSTINKVTSYITLEGGFDPSINWDKISTAGATRILRTATRSTSTTTTSLIQGSGIPNEFSANPEVVAIEVNNQTGFRFQDLTIRSQLTNPNIEFQGEPGVDVIGVRLNSCDQYNLVRTQINTSQAGKGGNQSWSIPAEDGGDARGLVANTNGAGTNLIQSNITAGAAGAGGNSNANGSPTPLAGSPGTTQAIQITGTAFATNQSSFNLVGQPTIQMDDVACTATNMDYNSSSSNSWNLGLGSSPTTGSGTTITTQYSTLGRKDIGYGSNNYIGFANIILDSQVLPDFDIDAPIVLGEHRICVGDNITVYATNGGVGYIYHWNITNNNTGFSTTFTTNIDQIGPIQVDTTGHYTIELRYETSCCGLSTPTTKDLYVEEIPIPVMPADENICLGQTNAVTLNVGGVTTNGSISWSPTNGLSPTNASPAYALPNITTTYFATLTDSTGMCDATDSVTITVIDLILTPSSTQALCGPDGSASVSVTGGSGNYSYLWSSGQSSQTATNLQSGTYSVVVTDITEGCKDSIDVVVPTAPASLVATSTKTDALCTGSNNGEITVELTGGSSPYTYSWSHLGTNITKPDTFDVQQNLAPGIYTVTITDNNNCSYTTTDTISEPSPIVFSIDSVLNPSCYGSNDGFIGIRPDGGTRPYSFTWSNGMPVNYFNAKIEENNLPIGDYTLTLTDDNGCIDSITISLSSVYLTDSIYDTLCIGESYTTIQNGSFVVSSDTVLLDTLLSPAGCDSILTSFVYVHPLPTVLANTSDVAICPDDSLYLYGTGADTYVWSTGLPDSAYFTPPIGNTDYYVTGTDTNGCINNDTVTVTVNPFPTVVANASPNDTLCEGEQVTLTGSGAQAPYTWLPATVSDGIAFVPPLGSSQYIVTASDANGCTGSDTINILVNPLPAVVANASDVAICEGDSIYLYGTGASTYTWSDGAQSYQDSAYFVPPAGSNDYYVLGTDANGCENRDTVTIVVTPLPTVLANTSDIAICPDDSLYLYGTGADTYVWSTGLPDSAYFTPPLGNTDYYVTGTDANGCINNDTVTVTVNPFPTVVANVSPNDTLCEGEQLTLTGSGAQAPYTWLPATVSDGVAFVPPLGSSQYIVTASDANGCTDSDTINILVNPLPAVVANASDAAICEGDSIYLYGTGASTYTWSDGAQSYQDSAYFVPPAGSNDYYVLGTDANGCENRDTVTIVVTPAPTVVANTTGNNLCTPATITLTGSGTAGVTYTWNPATVTNGVPFNPPVDTTDYIVTGIQTATGCSAKDTITIIIYPLPTIIANASPNDTLCQGEQLTLTGSGAQAPYTWTGGSGGITDGTPFTPQVGTTVYTVTATDANGCTNDTTITIVVHPNPTVGVNVSPNDSLCGGEQITLNGTGAQTYTWIPNTVTDGVAFEVNQGATTYTVTGTDVNGCVGTATQNIYGYMNYEFFNTVSICEDETYTLENGTVVSQAGTYTVNFPTTANGCDSTYNTTVNVNRLVQYTPLDDIRVCSGLGVVLGVGAQNTTAIQWFVSANGAEQSLAGNANYVNTTSDSLGFNLDVSLHENIYIIQMTDECGRVTRDSMLLEVFAPHAVDNPVADTTFCMHEIDIITVNYNGHSYEWNNGTLGASVMPTEAGDYIVNFVENYTGCLLSDTINIGLEDCIGNCVVLAPTGFSPDANGTNDIFRVVTSCEEGFDYFEMTVYNRWGELVYYTDDWREGWDGTYKGRDAEIGVYTYYVEYTKSISQEKGSIKGNVTLVR